MKRRDLMKELAGIAKALGLDMQITEGGSHTKVTIGGQSTTVPRHNEINEHTARGIIRHMGGSR